MRKRGNGTLVAVCVGLAGLFAAFLPTSAAYAHGGYTFPADRTYACFMNATGGTGGGALDPTNPACAAALEEGGSYAFWNWFGNLLSQVDGRHREVIDNGELCGPSERFAAFSEPRPNWPTTELQANSTITFKYEVVAGHPGTFYLYVTKDGYDPSEPLGWDDIEPFYQVTDPPIVDGAYTWQAQLPDKSGRHVIYTIWERSDSPESFYNCSDVVFTGGSDDGGNEGDPGDPTDNQSPTAPGQPSASEVTGTSASLSWPAASDNVGVTGYEVYRANGELVASTAGATSVTVDGLTPGTRYEFSVVARDAAGNVSAASPTVTVTTRTDAPAGQCEVTYTVANEWSSGFTARVTIANTGQSTINGWTLEWDFSAGQTVTNGWSGQWSQSGEHVTVQNAGYNGTIAPGASVTLGFNATIDGSNPEPSTFLLNGTHCTSG